MYWNISNKERLLIAFTKIDTTELSEKFLSDLLTEREIETCTQRLLAMCLLYDLASYKEVRRITGLSSATIARLAKRVNIYEGGFRTIIEEFKKAGPAYSE